MYTTNAISNDRMGHIEKDQVIYMYITNRITVDKMNRLKMNNEDCCNYNTDSSTLRNSHPSLASSVIDVSSHITCVALNVTNSLSPGDVVMLFKLQCLLRIKFTGTSCEIALGWMTQTSVATWGHIGLGNGLETKLTHIYVAIWCH